MVLGIRGMPNVQGGVETHAEQLYQRLAALGCDVEVLVRTPFVSAQHRSFAGIRLQRLWAPRRNGYEALLHSIIGVLYAGVRRPDILHIHAIGPSIVTPIARLLRLRVVVTHHGPDYDRDKWGSFARWILRTGERVGMRYSLSRIAISKVIVDLIRDKYGRDSYQIPNGVNPPKLQSGTEYLERFGVQRRQYFLQVSRMVPEKRQLDLIRAFEHAQIKDWKLVLVGGLDTTDYSAKVKQAASANPNVVLTGFLSGIALQQIYSHAAAFVLPSSHEGLPIAILEALSYGLPVLSSDIPANLEVGLEPSSYFRLGDTEALARALRRSAQDPQNEFVRTSRSESVMQRYDWDEIALQTLAVYRSVLEPIHDPGIIESRSGEHS